MVLSNSYWILPDLTIQGSIRLNYNLRTFPNIYYFSYATKRTWKVIGVTVHSWMLGIPPLFFFRVWQMSQCGVILHMLLPLIKATGRFVLFVCIWYYFHNQTVLICNDILLAHSPFVKYNQGFKKIVCYINGFGLTVNVVTVIVAISVSHIHL